MRPPRLLRHKGRYILPLVVLLSIWSCKERQNPQQNTNTAPAPAAASAPKPAPPSAPPSLYADDGCLKPVTTTKAPAPPFDLSGRLGLWVALIDPKTLVPTRAVGTNPNSVFPLASTYKQAVLWAVTRQFDQGQLLPTERFNITRQNQSLGSYPYDGTNVKELSVRMIRNSDNTATDILHRRVGLQAVQDTADRLGLCQTRLILPTKDWWVAEAGLSPTFEGTTKWAGARGPERLRLAQAIDKDAQQYRPDYLQRQLDRYFEDREEAGRDLLTHNVSTPYEFGTLLAHEYLRPGLGPRALGWQREVAAMGYGKSALKVGKITYFAGKGGNGWRILTYTGYIQLADGRHLVYAFMQHWADQTYTMPNTRRAFAWINAGIAEVLRQDAH